MTEQLRREPESLLELFGPVQALNGDTDKEKIAQAFLTCFFKATKSQSDVVRFKHIWVLYEHLVPANVQLHKESLGKKIAWFQREGGKFTPSNKNHKILLTHEEVLQQSEQRNAEQSTERSSDTEEKKKKVKIEGVVLTSQAVMNGRSHGETVYYGLQGPFVLQGTFNSQTASVVYSEFFLTLCRLLQRQPAIYSQQVFDKLIDLDEPDRKRKNKIHRLPHSCVDDEVKKVWVVAVEISGVEEKNIKVQVLSLSKSHHLEITGERTFAMQLVGQLWTGLFRAEVELPSHINVSQFKTLSSNGILYVCFQHKTDKVIPLPVPKFNVNVTINDLADFFSPPQPTSTTQLTSTTHPTPEQIPTSQQHQQHQQTSS